MKTTESQPAGAASEARGDALAQAHPNIALVKYWGKRDRTLNLPAVPSLSITLDRLWTRTRVRFDAALEADRLELNGKPAPRELERLRPTLDRLRALADCALPACIESSNNFPTAAGLASSASGFAALVVAAARALGLRLEAAKLSELARQGSGSAARSIFGGFVEMALGERADGSDAVARPLLAAAEWPLEVVVAVTDPAAKAVTSTDGMEHSAASSEFHAAWVRGAAADLEAARAAVTGRDFERLAEVSEASCLKMHATALAARPGLLYWNGATVEGMHAVRQLRREGIPVFFTVDAGPQLKAVCLPGHGDTVAGAIARIPGVHETLRCGLGEGAQVLDPEVQQA